MPKIIFLYEKNKYEMIIESKISIDKIFEEYLSMIDQKKEDIIFLYKGNKLNYNSCFSYK